MEEHIMEETPPAHQTLSVVFVVGDLAQPSFLFLLLVSSSPLLLAFSFPLQLSSFVPLLLFYFITLPPLAFP